MSPEQVAWMAGLLEGEGYFAWIHPGLYGQARIALGMTDHDVVRRVAVLTGVGRLTSPRRQPGCKPILLWRVNRRQDVESVLRAILPHMGERRGQRIRHILVAMALYQVVKADKKGLDR